MGDLPFAVSLGTIGGHVSELARYADPRVACIVAYRRCRVTGQPVGQVAHSAAVEHVAGDGTRTPLLLFHREEQGVRVDPPDYDAIGRALPGFRLEHVLAVRTDEEGRLMIGGS